METAVSRAIRVKRLSLVPDIQSYVDEVLEYHGELSDMYCEVAANKYVVSAEVQFMFGKFIEPDDPESDGEFNPDDPIQSDSGTEIVSSESE